MGKIHKFYLNNKYIILDVYSSSIFVVDKMTYDIVDEIDKTNDEVYSLFSEYSKEEIDECLSELRNLKEEDIFFLKK